VVVYRIRTHAITYDIPHPFDVPLTAMITAMLVTSFSAGIATAVEQIGGYAVGDLWCGKHRRCVRSAVDDEVGDPPANLCCEEGVEFVERLIDGAAGDVVVDYRKPSLVEDIRPALPEGRSRCLRLMR
jgi:hypothetical protein